MKMHYAGYYHPVGMGPFAVGVPGAYGKGAYGKGAYGKGAYARYGNPMTTPSPRTPDATACCRPGFRPYARPDLTPYTKPGWRAE